MTQETVELLSEVLKKFSNCTLCKASRDDTNHEAMCDSRLQVIDFDKIPNEKLKERINGVIVSSFEGNSSLHSKLETLIERLSVTFETADWDLFDKLKKNRQRLIHNKKRCSS